ncbi:DUF997 family protein [Adlercreutzia murintestinalis]|jgi:Protein of unknown function (DUF997).|uniref:DUF997 family protein n=1 Tax=Adlercreutzia murintestinalis TaxID=2941325 RepID=UPI00203FFA7C|nr:DUF997 family protein [Adlercreutzia murintestinalis]
MDRDRRKYRTYRDKLRRANREAAYTVVALGVIAIAWLLLGFGLADSDVRIASTPLWIVGGTVGTWLVAVIVAVVLAKRVFANFDLDDRADGDD